MFLERKNAADLEDELFERVKNDDLKDALAYQLQVATITPQQRLDLGMDPFSIEAVLLELAHKNATVFKLLEAGLKDEIPDSDKYFRQLREA